MDRLVLIAIGAPFAAALLAATLGRQLRARTAWLALAAPLAAFAAMLGIAPNGDTAARVSWEWLPSLGVNLTFNVDGLARFFALLVSGMGALVIFYARHYLDDTTDHGRFYAYLLAFMGAMLATVLSENLLVLFVAWELTGVTSFLLIGFLHADAGSQRGARMALITTGGTGLALLAGVLLLRVEFGTFELGEIVAAVSASTHEPTLLPAALLCCLVGIAGKSALIPFHYWLPQAMAAPTPVSAYLHSATMVKLGVFLSARLLPVFNGVEMWTPALVFLGFGTLLLGVALALLSHDLKAILAYTTVAQLGLLVGFYGLHARGTPLTWDYLHIASHGVYKACLFMVVGIIDHSTGTRDLRQLGGLRRAMPFTAAIALVALAAFAGLPPTVGFLSKEALLASTLGIATARGSVADWAALVALIVASIGNVVIALRIWQRGFCGALPEKLAHHFHAPSLSLQLAPAALALVAAVAGLFAGVTGDALLSLGGPTGHDAPHLTLWHGFTIELALSAAIIVGGALLFAGLGRKRLDRARLPVSIRAELAFDAILDRLPRAGTLINRGLSLDRPERFLLVVGSAAAVLILGVGALAWPAARTALPAWPEIDLTTDTLVRWTVAIGCAAGALATAFARDSLRQLFAVSAVGVGLTVYYVLFRAPDLALTQLLIESATLLLVLIVVIRFRRDGSEHEKLPTTPTPWKAARLATAVALGAIAGGGVLVFSGGFPMERAGAYYLEHTVALAHGHNTVNTIVVDFRGWDTLLEIAVLVVAAAGCLGLLYRRRRRAMPSLTVPHDADLFPVPHDLILRRVAIGAIIPLNLLALFLLLRGHNAPGGGFIAGLVTGLSLILLGLVLGVQGLRRWIRIDGMMLAALGVALALGTAALPMALSLPFLHHLHPTVLGIYAGSPLLFDLGVYLAVAGVTLKILMPLMKSIHGLPAFAPGEDRRYRSLNCEPIDLAAPATPAKGKENAP